jgi:hypothetical protein
VLESEAADARAGADHDGHPGVQVTAGVCAERLGGVGGADDEDDLHALQRLGDVAGNRLQAGEPLEHALSLDAAAFADRRQMVVVGALRVQGDPVPLARPLIGDRQPATARPQHRDVHDVDSIRPRFSGTGDGNLLTNGAPHASLRRRLAAGVLHRSSRSRDARSPLVGHLAA